MAEALAVVLAFAVGIAASPIPIVAVILVLFSSGAARNGPTFLLGWVLGLSGVVGALALAAGAVELGDGGDQGPAWVRLGVGAVLLVVAVRTWSARPGPDEEPALPSWMARIDGATPPRVLGLSLALAANPKNLALTAGAVSGLAELALDTATTVAALAAFVAVSSTVVALAVGYRLVGGRSAQDRLASAKDWLLVHNDAVMAGLFAVFGLVLLVQGLGSIL